MQSAKESTSEGEKMVVCSGNTALDDGLARDQVFHQQTWGVRDIPITGRDAFPFWKGRVEFSTTFAEIWYADQGQDYYVRLVDEPGTLAHFILACKADIPAYGKPIQVIGDKVNAVLSPPPPPPPPQPEDDDSEDCTQLLERLPLIQVEANLHFTKPTSYRSEIEALLKCQGSTRIVQLLGRSSSGELVFQRHKGTLLRAAKHLPVKGKRATIKRWLLDLVDAVTEMHSVGIVHRDLVLRNILEAEPLVVCDLQRRYSSSGRAPEVMDWETAQYSPASDVYAIGYCIREMCYGNTPFSPFADYPVPEPFDAVFEACTRAKAEDRPSMQELRDMVERIQIL